MSRIPPVVLAIAAGWGISGCAPESDTAPAGDEPGATDPTTETPATETEAQELDCEDGFDDDDDGQIDCDDSDCDGVFVCTWPASVEIFSIVEYDANSTAETFGVTDCALDLGGWLDEGGSVSMCDGCDLLYTGAVTYDMGNCPSDYITTPNPLVYGFVFIDEHTRQVSTHEDGAWELLGESTRGGDGTWELTTTETVLYDVPLLGEVDVGTFTIRRTFTDG